MFNKNKNKRQVININDRIDANQNKSAAKKTSLSGRGFYYSFLTMVLLLCLVQITVSAILNISKVISYKAKIIQITKTRDAALALNDQLKDNIKNFSNVNGLEAIARNNLKMSGEDEVLVIINTQNEEKEKKEEHKFLGLLKNKQN